MFIIWLYNHSGKLKYSQLLKEKKVKEKSVIISKYFEFLFYVFCLPKNLCTSPYIF